MYSWSRVVGNNVISIISYQSLIHVVIHAETQFSRGLEDISWSTLASHKCYPVIVNGISCAGITEAYGSP